jgi:hypothetical protein
MQRIVKNQSNSNELKHGIHHTIAELLGNRFFIHHTIAELLGNRFFSRIKNK